MNNTTEQTQKEPLSAIFRPAVSLFLVLTLVTGLAYPLLVTVAARAMFPFAASGSLIVHNGKVVGSELIGQTFSSPQYFWGRPSATSPMSYNAAASSGSNQGPLNPALLDAVKGHIAALRAADPANHRPIPIDLVTASGSGLDPHISPAAAAYQLERVANARKLDAAVIRKLVKEHTQKRQWGLFGEPVVNVLRLNLALDGLAAPDAAVTHSSGS